MNARVLVVALDDEVSERIAPILRRRDLAVERVASGREAAQRCVASSYDLVVCRYPLPDTVVRSLMEVVRGAGSPCRDTPILALTIPEMRVEAKIQLERGPFRVLSQQERTDVLHEAVAQLLALAPRRSPRVGARLRVDLGSGAGELEGRVVNLSSTGALVDGIETLPVGSRCHFELALPDGSSAISGEAQVVRQSRPSLERVRGVAISFLRFEGDGRERLERGLVEI